MAIESIWPYFALVAAALALISLPVFRIVDATSQVANRYATLDGLRGFLAFSVFAFHLIITHRYLSTGEWRAPANAFYALLGPVGVSLFFMITGFLFWTKLLSVRGRMQWARLYQNRLFRIAPMYLFTVLAMLLIVFIATDFRLNEPATVVIAAVLQWLALGIINLQPDVNGYPATRVIASVTWTISYEWAFYASLLATAYFARMRAHLLLVAIAWALCLMARIAFKIDTLGFVALFLSGMLVASVIHAGWVARWPDRLTSALALGCLALIFLAAPLGHPLGGYGTAATVLLTICFYFICSGASLFGLLATRAARRLGNISYSIYLLQGLVLTIVLAGPGLRGFALAAPVNYWLAGLLCTVVLITVSCLTYAFIELPCMQFGKLRRPLPLHHVRPGLDHFELGAGDAPGQQSQGFENQPTDRLPGRAPGPAILPQ